MNADFEVKGRVRPQFGLDDQLNPESFDVEFSSTGQVFRHAEYTNALAVLRTSRWIYDGAGQLIRALEYDPSGVEISVSDCEYSEGRRECITRDGTGSVTCRAVEEFVGSHIVRLSSYDGSGKLRKSKLFEYADGKLSESNSKYHGLNGELCEQWMTSYDSAGRVAKTFGLKADGAPLGDGKYAYEYDEQGRRIKVWSFNDFEDVAIAVTDSEYTNDEHGNWIERVNSYRSVADSTVTKSVTTRHLTYFPEYRLP
jgi:hypothetical protein